MNLFLFNLLLAIVWLFLTGVLSPLNLAAGFLIGFGALRILRPVFGNASVSYFSASIRLVRFILYFIPTLMLANLQIARAVLSPKNRMSPNFVECDLTGLSKTQAVIIANLVTLTPGTLSAELTRNGRRLLVHAIFAKHPDTVRRQVHALQHRLWGPARRNA